MEDLKLPVEDDDCCRKLRKAWEDRGENSVFFTVMRACGKEKIIAMLNLSTLVIDFSDIDNCIQS